jgi:hypothetical protein
MRTPFLVIFFAACLPISFLSAQSYVTAGGIRIVDGIHLTVQQYIAHGWTAEGIVHTALGANDLGLTLLGEKHHKVVLRNTNIFTGAGFHYYGKNQNGRSTTVGTNVFGASLIGGVEVSIGKVNVSLDWKPELHFTGDSGLVDWYGAGLSVRYIFLKRERKTIKDWKFWDNFKRKGAKNQRK